MLLLAATQRSKCGDDGLGCLSQQPGAGELFPAYLTTVVDRCPLRHVCAPATVTSHVPLINAGAKTIEGNGGRAPPPGRAPRRRPACLRSRVDNSWVAAPGRQGSCGVRKPDASGLPVFHSAISPPFRQWNVHSAQVSDRSSWGTC